MHRGETLRKARVQDLLPGLSSGPRLGIQGTPTSLESSLGHHCFPLLSWRFGEVL